MKLKLLFSRLLRGQADYAAVKPTPILRGKDAKEFEKKIKKDLKKPTKLIPTPKLYKAHGKLNINTTVIIKEIKNEYVVEIPQNDNYPYPMIFLEKKDLVGWLAEYYGVVLELQHSNPFPTRSQGFWSQK